MTIKENLMEIRHKIEQVCLRCGRKPTDVQLIGASKRQPLTHLISAVQGGLKALGENYVQELLQKQEIMTQKAPESFPQLQWHFIGRLQRRKVRQLIGHVDWIHSLDRIELASEIERRAAAHNICQRALIQVHLGEETTKGGVDPAELPALLKACRDLTHLRIMGLMTLPTYQKDAEQTRPHFRQLSELRDAINREAVYKEPLTELSMGMSHDYAVAIEEGATMVRIGTALFGGRNEP